MRFRRTTRTALALGVAAVIALAGCGGGPAADQGSAEFTQNPSGSLSAWGFNNADEVGTSRLEHAKSQLDGVEVSMDQTAFDPQKFTTRVASGQIADVVQMNANEVATYAAQDLLTPLDECFSTHGMDPTEYFYPAVLGDISYDDQIYAVPQFYQPPAIMLNMRVLKQAGVQPEDIDTSDPDRLIAAIEKMYTEQDGNPTRLGFHAVADGQAALWILGYGGQLMDEAGRPTLDDPANVDGLEVLKRIADAQGGFAEVKSFSDSFDWFGEQNQYVTDQVGAQLNAQWYVNVLTPYVDDVQISAVPFHNSDGEPFTVTSGTSFVIPAGAKNKDAACAWAINLVSKDAWMAAGEARAETVEKTEGALNTGLFTGSPVADQAIRESYVSSTGNTGFDQTIDTYYQIVGEGETLGASPAGQQINNELTNVVSAVLLGKKEPEQALKDAQAAALRAYQQTSDG